MARKIDEINAGSMADIAFLLLIFFLVATTMNVDSGIQRVLPPMQDESDVKPIDIKKRNILLVFVSKFDNIMVGGERMDITQLKDKIKEFVLNPNNDENLPETEDTKIEGAIGVYPVSKGVVSLQNDRGTSYNLYIMVQNELTRAFNEIRDEVSEKYYHKPFMELEKSQRDAVQKAVPLKISEAEPRNIGGN